MGTAANLEYDTPQESEKPDAPAWETSEKAFVVLQAAQKIFFEHGFSAATTDMIQREAKVSKSTLYQHFQNKEGMFRAVIQWVCKRNFEEAQLESITGGDIREKLINLAKAYLRLLMKNETIALFRIVVEVSTVFPHLMEMFYASGPGIFQKTIQKTLSQAMRDGELAIPPAEVMPATLLFCAMVRGEPHLLHILFPHKDFSQKELNAWITLSVDRFLAAYSAR